MTKFLIVGVHYESEGRNRRIASVKVCPDYGYDPSGDPLIWQVGEVVNAIKFQLALLTTTFQYRGYWYRGAVVQVYSHNNRDYLRSDSNEVAADNLANIREF